MFVALCEGVRVWRGRVGGGGGRLVDGGVGCDFCGGIGLVIFCGF